MVNHLLKANSMQNDIKYIIDAHKKFPKKPAYAYRKWDQKTPYSIHPIWCSMTILTEWKLPKRIRKDGYLTLLYHDVLEDTKQKLPEKLSIRVKQYVADMSYLDIEDEMVHIWEKEKAVRLFKLYDKVSNLLDSPWMNKKQKNAYIAYTQKLLTDVEENYGNLNITQIAKSILDNLS